MRPAAAGPRAGRSSSGRGYLLLNLLLLLAAAAFALLQPPRADVWEASRPFDPSRPSDWLHPLERNAFKRQVIPHNLFGVTATSDGKVWAVGNSGLLLRSEDRGTSWSAVASGSQSSLNAVTALPAAAGRAPALVAVGSGGTVLRSADGGASWSAVASGSQSSLNAVTALPAAAGQAPALVAVGSGGTVLRSADGGASWSAVASGSQSVLTAVTALPAAAGQAPALVAVGDEGTVLRSADGGASWSAVASGSQSDLGAVTALPAAAGQAPALVAVGSEGTVLRSADGGASWSAVASGSRSDLSAVTALPAAAGQAPALVAVGLGGIVLRSADGGASWSAVASGTQSILTDVTALPAAAGQAPALVAVGREGTVLRSADGGASWSAVASGSQSRLTAVTALPAAAGQAPALVAVGSDGTALRSADGGASWSVVASSNKSRLTDVTALPAAAGQAPALVAVGFGTVLRSTDGGVSWSAVASGSQGFLTAVTALPAAAGQAPALVAVGAFGTVLRSTDSGASWSAVASGSQSRLTAVTALPAAAGQTPALVAVGSEGTVLRSADGGASWSAVASGSRSFLQAVTALPAAAGQPPALVAVGSEGTVLRSADGGASWSAVASGSRSILTAVTALPAAAGQAPALVAVGREGTVLRSADGGASWSAVASGSPSVLTAVTALPAAAGQPPALVVVGGEGTVLRSADGGLTWMEDAGYRRLPSALASLLLLLAAVGAAHALARMGHASPADEAASAASEVQAALTSDRPITDRAEDRLGHAVPVQALLRFITHRQTQPKATLAITGEWGSGKSSMMGMLRKELDAAGFRTVWFNAWHHQQEGRPLAALFHVIRQQALPPLLPNPIPRTRVRLRLLWARGWGFRMVMLGSLLFLAFLVGDFVRASGGLGATDRHVERLGAAARYHLGGEKPVKLTRAGLAALQSLAPPEAASAASPVGMHGKELAQYCAAPAEGNTGVLPAETFCRIARTMVWTANGSQCGITPETEGLWKQGREGCVFNSIEDLIATAGAGSKLEPEVRQALRKAAVPVEAPQLLPGLEAWFAEGLGALFLIFLLKGFSIYGLEVLSPLKSLLAAVRKDVEAGKENTGTVERYRREFALLCTALDKRLVIFIDDLDRCRADTVQDMLELSNYLVDTGECFIVLGAAMDRVKRCIKAPYEVREGEPSYADQYLHKLVHVEVPVPAGPDQLAAMVSSRPVQEAAGRLKDLLDPFVRSLPAVLLTALMIGLAVLAFNNPMPGESAGRVVKLALPVELASAVKPGPASQPPTKPSPQEDLPRGTEPTAAPVPAGPFTQPPGDTGRWAVLLTVLLAVTGGLSLALSGRLRQAVTLALGGALRQEDSAGFSQSLRLWQPLIAAHAATPRHTKRFVNRARLMAAYEACERERSHAPEPQAPRGPGLWRRGWIGLLGSLGRWMEGTRSLQALGQALSALGRREAAGFADERRVDASVAGVRIPDEHLVALTALHQVDPKMLDGVAHALINESTLPEHFPGRAGDLAKKLMSQHSRQFQQPRLDLAMVERFKQRVEGMAVR